MIKPNTADDLGASFKQEPEVGQHPSDSVKHEVWQDEEGLTTVCFSDERGDDCRALLEPGSKLIYEFFANCHYDAMTIYYKFMDWGTYTTEFEIDKKPYSYIEKP